MHRAGVPCSIATFFGQLDFPQTRSPRRPNTTAALPARSSPAARTTVCPSAPSCRPTNRRLVCFPVARDMAATLRRKVWNPGTKPVCPTPGLSVLRTRVRAGVQCELGHSGQCRPQRRCRQRGSRQPAWCRAPSGLSLGGIRPEWPAQARQSIVSCYSLKPTSSDTCGCAAAENP